VHQRCRQPGDRVPQRVLRVVGDPVRLGGGDVRRDDDLAFGAQVVACPAQPHLADL